MLEQVQKSAPRQIDERTRLDGAKAGPSLNFTYQYTLIHATASALDRKGRDALREELFGAMANDVCHGAEFEQLRKLGVTVHFSYRDKVGVLFLENAVGPATCTELAERKAGRHSP